ncbi:DUF4260 domain-containing protein [Lacibacter sp. H375]|uniref:DUF4260 domain-containing protein n=1 Tax=Lacibacter sp. H375 TaxID=3133424 RepID=UPI0030C00637
MKTILKLEELAMFLASAYVLYYFDSAWWFYLLLLLGPDISMIGYLAGNKIGAWSYNLFHHKGIAIALIAAGFMIDSDALIITGVILFGHASMDRVAGYGLKYENGFKFTHLGEIGKK